MGANLSLRRFFGNGSVCTILGFGHPMSLYFLILGRGEGIAAMAVVSVEAP